MPRWRRFTPAARHRGRRCRAARSLGAPALRGRAVECARLRQPGRRGRRGRARRVVRGHRAGSAVGVADAELRRLDAAGFRGARFHFMGHLGAAGPIADVHRAGRAARAAGLAPADPLRERVCVHDFAPAFRRSPVPVVIDHMAASTRARASSQPDFQLLREPDARRPPLGQGQRVDRVHARGSALCRRAAVRARCSRRPATGCCGAPTGRIPISRARARRRRARRPDRADRAHRGATPRLLVDNPRRLYRFGAPHEPLPRQGRDRHRGRVRGAGWGNGRAIAVRLAKEGAQVLAVDRDPERLAETLEQAGRSRAVDPPMDVRRTTHAPWRRWSPMRCGARPHRRAGQQRRRFRGGRARRDDGGSLRRAGGLQPEERVHLLQARAARDAATEVGRDRRTCRRRQACAGPAPRRSPTPRPRPASSSCRAWWPCNTRRMASA